MNREDEILMAESLNEISWDIMQYVTLHPIVVPRDELVRWATAFGYVASLLKDEE